MLFRGDATAATAINNTTTVTKIPNPTSAAAAAAAATIAPILLTRSPPPPILLPSLRTTTIVAPKMPPAANKSKAAAGSAAAPANSRKRKLDSDKNMQKYYAVRAGVRPGIYLTWVECQAQIAGFKGAQYKSFFSREDAAAFVAGKNPEGGTKDKGDRFYAVAVGTRPGIYTDWESASLAIVGAKGPKFKKFGTRAEAETFIRTFGNAAARATLGDVEEDEEEEEEEEEEDDEAELFSIVEPPAKKAKPSKTSSTGFVDVFTDGSSLSNGKAGAAAGVGVFFGVGDQRNISERLAGEVQTNQRAELTAILRALQTVGKRQPVRIFSDSKYAINCVTEWYRGWMKNGWKTRQGDVLNQDLVKAVRAAIDARDKAGVETQFHWVKGHGDDEGNLAADKLAVQGARMRA